MFHTVQIVQCSRKVFWQSEIRDSAADFLLKAGGPFQKTQNYFRDKRDQAEAVACFWRASTALGRPGFTHPIPVSSKNPPPSTPPNYSYHSIESSFTLLFFSLLLVLLNLELIAFLHLTFLYKMKLNQKQTFSNGWNLISFCTFYFESIYNQTSFLVNKEEVNFLAKGFQQFRHYTSQQYRAEREQDCVDI